MERLTEFKALYLLSSAIESKDFENDTELTKCLNTLTNFVKKYKDIEEELGIDLITFFKALKHGINGVPPQELLLDIENKCFLRPTISGDYQVYSFKDYGKTWY